ncbi:hypothetical protein [Dehalococcoides sp. THU4]|uniref:hypothetical protein n=1 Tax=Dehalococcoides sp. THU4 TaxID=3348344 RepID=UPI0037241A42
MLYVLWGYLPPDQPYMETIIKETNDQANAKTALAEADKKGYKGLRIANYADIPAKPNFIGTISI